MLLTLVRHAKSSWSDPSLSDFDRPLNERGNRDAPRMARWFFENIQEMPILFTSPANRALSTAKYFEKDLPKYPIRDPINGKNNIAYSIYPFIPWISSTLIDPLFL